MIKKAQEGRRNGGADFPAAISPAGKCPNIGVVAFLGNVPVTPTPSIFPKVLPYKWGAYCRTNGRRTAVQMGGILQGFPFFEA